MAKSVMTVKIDKQLKEDFANLAKEFGTNTTGLLSMLMAHTVRKRKVYFDVSPLTELEIEEFTPEEIEAFGKDFNDEVYKKTKKLKKLLANNK